MMKLLKRGLSESTITTKGRTTVPAAIRQGIGGAPGARLIWQVQADGRLFVSVKKKPVLDKPSLLDVMDGIPGGGAIDFDPPRYV